MATRTGPLERFDAIVVGSGFGGSVMTYRLAKAGLRVCLLERGQAYPPGSYARRPHEWVTNFWDPSEGGHGLYDVWSFRQMDALVSSGLGGGSLIYANVLIEKPAAWFTEDGPSGEEWPIRHEDLAPHYAAVRAVMQATPFPTEHSPYGQNPKTLALADAAERLGVEWYRPPLAVAFASPGRDPVPGEPLVDADGRVDRRNIHGAPRQTCTLCAECVIGCNTGAKHTLDFNYLSLAQDLGAVIRTRCEVRDLAALEGGGYSIRYVEHDPARAGRRTDTKALPTVELRAERLVMAAGALGTPFLLLRSRERLPRLGPALGTRFCGNGDFLGFLQRAKWDDGRHRIVDQSRGTTVTSTIRIPDALDASEAGSGFGHYVQDGGVPVFVDWLQEASAVPFRLRLLLAFIWRRIKARWFGPARPHLSAQVAGLLGDGQKSATGLPLLGMGREPPSGTMRLDKHGSLAVDWDLNAAKAYYAQVRGTMKRIAAALNGRLGDNVIWRLNRVITVHPVGGCPMGRSIETGVVDGHGESFGHPGLFVVDGSALPGPVGPNPGLTIAAFADRAADRLIAGFPAPGSGERTHPQARPG
jgi:cholesterol oxidase